MLDRMMEEARQQEVFSREDTPTEKRVFGAFLSHAGLSLRKIGPFVGCCYEAIRDWFHRCKHLFEPDCQTRQTVAVDETQIEIDGTEHHAWAAVDRATRSIGTSWHSMPSPSARSSPPTVPADRADPPDAIRPERVRGQHRDDRGFEQVGQRDDEPLVAALYHPVAEERGDPLA
jgi:hypothetical protein